MACINHQGKQEISYCPDCGPNGHVYALVRCPEHGIAPCGPLLYPGSRCPKHDKFPCSICRQVHGQEIQHACE